MPQSSLLQWLSADQKPSKATVPVPALKEQNKSHDKDATSSPLEPTREETNVDKSNATDLETRISISSKAPRPLSKNVEIRPCTKADIPSLKRITSLLLPIPYTEKFFREILDDPITNDLTLVATWRDDESSRTTAKTQESKTPILIGAILCRLLSSLPGTTPPGTPSSSAVVGDDPPMLYLSTLVLLSPYRSLGVASHMLQILIRRAVEDYGVDRVGAHVWTANEEGLEWYRRRGFGEVSREEGYYRRLSPSAAVVMQRKVGAADLE
jgi:ribosomal protein S18 acetylase RimI-like enzyme